MKNSYILRISGGRIVLPPQIRDQLTLPQNSRLYGVVAPDIQEPRSYILSIIPPDCWQTAFRLQVNTASSPGSLSRVAATLSRHGINVLAAWTAATSPSGEGCLTATVQIPANLIGTAVPTDAQSREIEGLLQKELEDAGALSRSRLFRGADALSLVRLTRLRVLAKLGSLYGENDQFRINLDESTLDLNGATNSSNNPLSLIEKRDHRGWLGNQVIITPDTEERYFRMAVLPNWTYKMISLNVRVRSPEGNFSGYYEQALSVLADDNLNLLSSRSMVVSKVLDEPDGQNALEEGEFSFLVDVTQSKYSGSESDALMRGSIENRLREFGEMRGAEVEVPEDKWRMEDLWELSLPVFVATNAKPEIDNRWKNVALTVIRKLKERGLHPVNVDVSVGSSLALEVESLIRQCPLVVTLFLPEDGLLMAPSRTAKGNKRPRYAPSDYTMYEEAFARSLRRPVLRLRHKDVFKPRYLGDPIEYEFDESNVAEKIRAFETALDHELNSEDFYAAMLECRAHRYEQGRSGLRHIYRDIERWLLRENQPSVGSVSSTW